MAARFWQRVIAGEIVFAAAAAWLLAVLLPLSAIAMIASALAIFAALQWLPETAGWFLARVQARSPQAPERSTPWRCPFVWAALRSFATEGVALARAKLAMSMAPLRRPPHLDSPVRDRRPRPVLLIHGLLCNGAIWRTLVHRLEEAGLGPVRVLDLEPLWADLDYHAARVARDIIVMQRACGGEPVAIVAHSLGGLVARAALRTLATRIAPAAAAAPPTGQEAVSRLITIATPHHGTAAASVLPFKPMRQMVPGSPWLRALNASPTSGPAAAPLTSIYSLDDALVVPASSARLEGACNIELRGRGHLGLLASRHTSTAILRALAAGSFPRVQRCEPRDGARSNP